MEVEALPDADNEIDPESPEEGSGGPPDDPLEDPSEDVFELDVEKLWLSELSERESKAEPNVAMMKLNSGLSRSTA